MIFKVRVAGGFIERFLQTGKVIPKTEVVKGLPKRARLFMVHTGQNGEWIYLFEGKIRGKKDVEGAVEELEIRFHEPPA